MPPIIPRMCVIGVGLIGGSLVRALRSASAVGEVIGAGRNEQNLCTAIELGVIDRYEMNLTRAVRDADVVVIAVPLGMIKPVLQTIAPHLSPRCIVTDVGSAKTCVINDVRAVYGCMPPYFVPAHPIAGTEKSGVEASFATLYQGRRVILTPTEDTSPDAHAFIRQMWALTGADVIDMRADDHDAVLAATSHLPHLLAYSLVDTLAKMDERVDVFRYAAGGFRDFTRIASSDPQMWHDICVANRAHLLDMITRFSADLSQLAEAIRCDDHATILETFQRAKKARDLLTLD